MESTPGKRLAEWREFKGITLAEMSRITGIRVSTLSSSEQPGSSNPSYDTIAKVLAGFSDLNPDWLLLGTGSMLRDGRALTPVAPSIETEKPGQPEPPAMRVIKEDETTDYWRGLALERLDTIDFYKELLRGAYGIRPADDDQEPAEGQRKKEVASSYAADLRHTVDALASQYQYRIVAHHVGFLGSWMETELETA